MSEGKDLVRIHHKQLTTHSDDDVIIHHLMNDDLPDDAMTPKIKEKIQRVRTCQELREKYVTRMKVLPKLMEFYNISEATARRIFDLTTKVNGKVKPAERQYYVDLLYARIQQTYEFAKKSNDPRAMAMCDKNAAQVLRDLIPDNEVPAFEDLQPVDITIGFFPELTGIKLPENYQLQIDKLKQKKQAKRLDIQDAEIIPPDDPGSSE